MSLEGKEFEKIQKPIPPQGPQVAICYMICDVGTHMKSYLNQPAEATPCVHFGWELPNLPHAVFDVKKGPQPLALFQEYTVSLGDKAKLAKMLQSWRGIPCKDLANELPAFLGQVCQINVEYNRDKKKPEIIYANVGGNGIGVTRLMAGIQAGPLTNKTIFFNLDKYSHETFLQLPVWIQKKIQSSLEWSGIVAKFGAPPVQPTAQNAQQFGGQNQNFNPQVQNTAQPQNQGFNQQPVNQNPAQNTGVGFGGEAIKTNPFDGPPPF